jgi:hypothetical protein
MALKEDGGQKSELQNFRASELQNDRNVGWALPTKEDKQNDFSI